MRFLHISDLHIGKRLSGNVDITEDQGYILRQIVGMVDGYGCDAILIAGDIYDRTQPSERAIGMVDSFLRDLSATGRHIYMISGNHDSQAQVSYLSGILRRNGIFVSDAVGREPQMYTERDEFGEISIYLLPFVRISQVNRTFPEADARTLEEAYSYVIDSFGVDRSRRNVLVSHQFIRGAVKGGSEEMTIGGLEEIDSRILDPFDYAALGHIHAPQRAGRDGIRYSGSILKYHFDETDQEKGALIVDILEKGNVKIEKVPLRPMRDMRRIRGRFRDLLDLPGSDDYIEAILEDEELIMDARGSLSTVFPNIISVKRAERSAGRDIEEVSDPEKDSIEDHFRSFYMMQHDGKEPDDRQIALIRDTLRKMEEEDETVIS